MFETAKPEQPAYRKRGPSDDQIDSEKPITRQSRAEEILLSTFNKNIESRRSNEPMDQPRLSDYGIFGPFEKDRPSAALEFPSQFKDSGEEVQDESPLIQRVAPQEKLVAKRTYPAVRPSVQTLQIDKGGAKPIVDMNSLSISSHAMQLGPPIAGSTFDSQLAKSNSQSNLMQSSLQDSYANRVIRQSITKVNSKQSITLKKQQPPFVSSGRPSSIYDNLPQLRPGPNHSKMNLRIIEEYNRKKEKLRAMNEELLRGPVTRPKRRQINRSSMDALPSQQYSVVMGRKMKYYQIPSSNSLSRDAFRSKAQVDPTAESRFSTIVHKPTGSTYHNIPFAYSSSPTVKLQATPVDKEEKFPMGFMLKPSDAKIRRILPQGIGAQTEDDLPISFQPSDPASNAFKFDGKAMNPQKSIEVNVSGELNQEQIAERMGFEDGTVEKALSKSKSNQVQFSSFIQQIDPTSLRKSLAIESNQSEQDQSLLKSKKDPHTSSFDLANNPLFTENDKWTSEKQKSKIKNSSEKDPKNLIANNSQVVLTNSKMSSDRRNSIIIFSSHIHKKSSHGVATVLKASPAASAQQIGGEGHVPAPIEFTIKKFAQDSSSNLNSLQLTEKLQKIKEKNELAVKAHLLKNLSKKIANEPSSDAVLQASSVTNADDSVVQDRVFEPTTGKMINLASSKNQQRYVSMNSSIFGSDNSFFKNQQQSSFEKRQRKIDKRFSDLAANKSSLKKKKQKELMELQEGEIDMTKLQRESAKFLQKQMMQINKQQSLIGGSIYTFKKDLKQMGSLPKFTSKDQEMYRRQQSILSNQSSCEVSTQKEKKKRVLDQFQSHFKIRDPNRDQLLKASTKKEMKMFSDETIPPDRTRQTVNDDASDLAGIMVTPAVKILRPEYQSSGFDPRRSVSMHSVNSEFDEARDKYSALIRKNRNAAQKIRKGGSMTIEQISESAPSKKYRKILLDTKAKAANPDKEKLKAHENFVTMSTENLKLEKSETSQIKRADSWIDLNTRTDEPVLRQHTLGKGTRHRNNLTVLTGASFKTKNSLPRIKGIAITEATEDPTEENEYPEFLQKQAAYDQYMNQQREKYKAQNGISEERTRGRGSKLVSKLSKLQTGQYLSSSPTKEFEPSYDVTMGQTTTNSPSKAVESRIQSRLASPMKPEGEGGLPSRFQSTFARLADQTGSARSSTTSALAQGAPSLAPSEFEDKLLGALEMEAKQRVAYKKKLKRLKKECPPKLKNWEQKMTWLTEALPKLNMQTDVGLIQKIRKQDENMSEADQKGSSLQQDCRTVEYIKHMAILDDPLKEKIEEVRELIKDIPDTEDPYLLQEFKARRKKEKAHNLKQAMEPKSFSDKLSDLLTFEHGQRSSRQQRFRAMLKEMSKAKDEIINNFKFEYLDNGGKIDVQKVMAKFAKRKRATAVSYDFEKAVHEIIAEINKENEKVLETQNLAYVFKSAGQMLEVVFQEGIDNQRSEDLLNSLLAEQESEFQKYMRFLGHDEGEVKAHLGNLATFKAQMVALNEQRVLSKEANRKDEFQKLMPLHETEKLRPRRTTKTQASLNSQSLFQYVELYNQAKSDLLFTLMNRIEQFQKYKTSLDDSAKSHLVNDPQFKYLEECSRHLDLILPLFQKVYKHQLILDEYELKEGHCFGIHAACQLDPRLINRAVLFRNMLTDDRLSVLLRSFKRQEDFKRLSCTSNTVGEQTLTELQALLVRNVPMHMMELRFAHCSIKPNIMSKLITMINERSYLSSLSLVQVPLDSKECQEGLCEFIACSKHLRKIDLSYNNFGKDHIFTFKLLKILSRNKYLQDINLSYNSLFSQEEDARDEINTIPVSENAKVKRNQPKPNNRQMRSVAEKGEKLLKYLRKLLIKNTHLQHLSLASVGLNSMQIINLSKYVERAKSLVAVHFCFNNFSNPRTNKDRALWKTGGLDEILDDLNLIFSRQQLRQIAIEPKSSNLLRASGISNFDLQKDNLQLSQLQRLQTLRKLSKSDTQIAFYKHEDIKYMFQGNQASEFQGKDIKFTRSKRIENQISNIHQESIVARHIMQRAAIEQKNLQPSLPINHQINFTHNPDHEVSKEQLKDSRKFGQQPSNKLIISRVLGHPFKHHVDGDLGSHHDQWKIISSSKSTSSVNAQKGCWACQLHKYAIVFWSEDFAQQQERQNDIDEDQFFTSSAEEVFRKWKSAQRSADSKKLQGAKHNEAEKLRIQDEIDKRKQQERVMICGSFNHWKPERMVKLAQFLSQIDPDIPDVMAIMRAQGLIDPKDRHIKKYIQLNPHQKQEHDEILERLYEQKRENWPEILKNAIQYSQPAIINGELIGQLKSMANITNIYIYIGLFPPGKSNIVVRVNQNVNDDDFTGDERWSKYKASSSIHKKQTQPGRNTVLHTSESIQQLKGDRRGTILLSKMSNIRMSTSNQETIEGPQVDTSSFEEMTSDFDSSRTNSDTFLSKERFFFQKGLVDIRTEEIKPFTISKEGYESQDVFNMKAKVTKFEKETSMFKEYVDHESLIVISQCLQFDLMKLTDFKNALLEPNMQDGPNLDQVIHDHFSSFKYLFYVLQSNITSQEQYPHVNKQQIFDFCFRSEILRQMLIQIKAPQNQHKRHMSIFDQTNVAQTAQKMAVKNLDDLCDSVSPNGLFLRHQLIGLLINIAKFQCSNNLKAYIPPEALEYETIKDQDGNEETVLKSMNPLNKLSIQLDLLARYSIEPNIHKFESFPRDWREKELYTSEVDQVYSTNRVPLLQIFRNHIQPGGKAIQFSSVVELMQCEYVNDIGITEGQIVSCFAMSKQCVPHENIDQMGIYRRMNFSEFLELIGRISVYKFQDTELEFQIPLSSKVLHVLDDLFESIGLQAKDPYRPLAASQMKKKEDQDEDSGQFKGDFLRSQKKVQIPSSQDATPSKRQQLVGSSLLPGPSRMSGLKGRDERTFSSAGTKELSKEEPEVVVPSPAKKQGRPPRRKIQKIFEPKSMDSKGVMVSYDWCPDEDDSSSMTSQESVDSLDEILGLGEGQQSLLQSAETSGGALSPWVKPSVR